MRQVVRVECHLRYKRGEANDAYDLYVAPFRYSAYAR